MINRAVIVDEATLINEMVNRFLMWKLPKDFSPDAGISFAHAHPIDSVFWPTGTNLLNSQQAREMIQHILQGVTSE